MTHLLTFSCQVNRNDICFLHIYTNIRVINYEHKEEWKEVQDAFLRNLSAIYESLKKTRGLVPKYAIIFNDDDDIPNIYCRIKKDNLTIVNTLDENIFAEIAGKFNHKHVLEAWVQELNITCSKLRQVEFLRLIKYKFINKLHHLYKLKICYKCTKLRDVYLCNLCKKISYCGKECQKEDWLDHRYECNTKTETIRLFLPPLLTSVIINREYYNNVENANIIKNLTHSGETYGLPLLMSKGFIARLKDKSPFTESEKYIVVGELYKINLLLNGKEDVAKLLRLRKESEKSVYDMILPEERSSMFDELD